MSTDIPKAKRALVHLQSERQAQHERLQLATEIKKQLEHNRTSFNNI